MIWQKKLLTNFVIYEYVFKYLYIIYIFFKIVFSIDFMMELFYNDCIKKEKGVAMKRVNFEKKLMYREHFLTLCVIGLEFTNAIMNWM